MPCTKRDLKTLESSTLKLEDKEIQMPSATTTTTANISAPQAADKLRQALLTATICEQQIHLVVGSNSLASARCQKSLDAGASVILISPGPLAPSLQRRIDDNEVSWLAREFLSEDLTTLGREEVDKVVDLVFVTLPQECAQCAIISSLCRRLRIPINVVDTPSLCTFTLLSTYTDGPLQIGVTTSGNGCKLATRIKREISSSLPRNLGAGCTNLGRFRRELQPSTFTDEDESLEQPASFNNLVFASDPSAQKTRRMRWLSQICEYWPLDKLAGITPDTLTTLLDDLPADIAALAPEHCPSKRGKISLVGAGPGHPDLLTTAALKTLQTADLVLADKLVPAGVLALVPRRTDLFIAKKFPGNADAAQEELLSLGLAALRDGKSVVRLKQGDPYIYGRGAEEFEFFSAAGFRPVVIPGLSSALVAPTFAEIPATHRGVADQLLLCTGTGRRGAAPDLPAYVQSRTTVFLMALHRLEPLVAELREKGYPAELPCAVIERASCPDQRVIRTTLAAVVAAVAEEGSRPPGLLVTGWACNILHAPTKTKRWVVEEGFAGL